MSKFRNRLFVHQLAGVFIVALATSITSLAQTSEAAAETWTSARQNSTANANPYRTTESHVKSESRTLDKKTVEVRGPDGTYELYYRTEIETIQESPTLTRSITRTYNPGGDRNEHLTQIIEAETRGSDDGSRTVKTISNADLDGKFEVKEREISVTKKSSDSQKTQTTTYLPNTAGEFAPSMQINKQQEPGPNGSVETRKETLFPDLSGRWYTYEVREQTLKETPKSESPTSISRAATLWAMSPRFPRLLLRKRTLTASSQLRLRITQLMFRAQPAIKLCTRCSRPRVCRQRKLAES
jgi:hypothetical protein